MESSYTLLQSEIEDSLTKVAMKQGEEIVNQIKPILMKNISKKRLDVFLEGNPDYLEAYIRIIVENYRLYHSYIYSLQVTRDNEDWNPFLLPFYAARILIIRFKPMRSQKIAPLKPLKRL
jgi:hypothetical protein